MFFSKMPIQQCIKPREQRSVLCCSENRVSEKPANKACTGRWGFCGIFEHLSGFEFSLLPNRDHARPSTSNANLRVP